MYVVDTSAVLEYGSDMIRSIGDVLVPPCVVDELERKGEGELAHVLGVMGAVAAPDQQWLKTARGIAIETGDASVLSPCDIAVVALALMKGAGVLSADRAVANVCSRAGLEVIDPTGGFREQFTWIYRCSGCGRHFTQENALKYDGVCPVCGSTIKRRRKR